MRETVIDDNNLDSERDSLWLLWWEAARPKTLPAALAPVLIGTSLAIGDDVFHLWSALAAALGALMIQIGTNYANDYFDYKSGADSGERLGPTRATQAGLVTPAAMKRATMIAFALAFLVGIYLVYRGGWPIVAIGLSSIMFGVLYTGGPFPLGYNGLGDIFVLIFFGPVAVGGTYYVQTLSISPAVLVIGLAPGLFSMAILTVNNLRDIDNDRRAGKKTLAVRFGVRFARWEYLLSIATGVLIPTMFCLATGTHLFALMTLICVPTALFPIKAVFTVSGAPLNDVLAATGRLLLMFAVLFSVGWLM